LKNFAIQEKRKTDDYYKKILNDLENVYKAYLEGINDFIESINGRFDFLYQKLDTSSNPESKFILKISYAD
jgi:asparagine synthetase B (glutamine-hydrolysing)